MSFEDRLSMIDKKGDTEEAVEIVMVLDHSGSMAGQANNACKEFNKFLAEQKEVKGAANFTLIGFADTVNVAQATRLEYAKPMKMYKAEGSTALNDAMGLALSRLLARNPKRAIVSVITDGYENSSKYFTKNDVAEFTKLAEAKGWKVIYLAANQDAVQMGRMMGISGQSMGNWSASDPLAAHKVYASANSATMSYRAGTKGADIKIAETLSDTKGD